MRISDWSSDVCSSDLVPLGAFLSGGVDSSAVVALMAEASTRAVKTCTIGFDEAGHDERRFATEIARRFATDHRERIVAPDDFSAVDRLVTAFDEPFADEIGRAHV